MVVYPSEPRPQILLIGDPIGHSLSPRMQGALIGRLGLNYSYRTLRVPQAALKGWLASIRTTIVGFNVTMPHKITLVHMLDELSEDASLFASVNTVVVRDGKLIGYNTDGEGFIRALDYLNQPIHGKRFVILGAGGVARSIALKLLQNDAQAVVLCCRTPEHGEAIRKRAALIGCQERLLVAGFGSDDLGAAFSEADCLVNATPIGMNGFPTDWLLNGVLNALPPKTPVHDLVYAPVETQLLKSALLLGHPVTNGLHLLIHQGILSLERFTGLSISPLSHLQPLMHLLLR